MSVKKRNIAGFPLDALQIFGESENITASGVIGDVVDLKGYGFGQGSCVFDVILAEDGDGDETYEVVLELSDDLAFSVPVAYGSRAITRGQLGRDFFPMNNQVNETLYRYARLSGVLAGTTPSLTVTAFLSEEVMPKG